MTNTIKFSQFALGDPNVSTNMIVGVSSDIGGTNFQLPAVISWTTDTRPVTPYAGLLGFNTNYSQYEYWNGTTWIQLAGGGAGTVTEILTGTGLIGGPITNTGTVSFSPIAADSLWANNTGSVAVPSVVSLSTFLQSANNLSDLTSISAAQTNIGLRIGVNVEAWSAILDSIVAGTMPGSVQIGVNSFNHGTAASTTTFLRGDGTWTAPSGSGSVNSGTQYDLGYYATSGNAISPISTLASSALLTNNSGVPAWVAYTGSGAPVLDNSPTLITPALGTPSSGILTNLTGYTIANLSDVAWIDYSGTISYTGFSSTTTNMARWKQIGKTVFVELDMYGTSNAVNFIFGLPTTAATLPVSATISLARIVNNNNYVSNVCYGTINSGLNSCTLSISDNSNGWTSSNTKGVRCSFFYETS